MAHTLTWRVGGRLGKFVDTAERTEHDCIKDAMAFAMEECKWENTTAVRVFDDGGMFVKTWHAE